MVLPFLPQSEAKICYSVRRAAELTDRSERSLWRDIRAGKIAVFKIGQRILIPHRTLIQFLEAHLDASGSPVRSAPPHITKKQATTKAQPSGTRQAQP